MDSIHVRKFDGEVYLFRISGSPPVDMCEEQFIAPVDGLLARGVPFTLIIDCREVSSVSLSASWMIVNWIRSNRGAIERTLRGTAILSRDPFIQRGVEFVFSIQTPFCPVQLVDLIEDAWFFVHQIKETKTRS